jgi:RES domain-containing protein
MFPSLAAAHAVGIEIRTSIDQFPITSVRDDLLYRARTIKDGRELRSNDFLAPDPTKVAVGEGRFNHQGQSVLYLASDADGAVIEIVKEDEMRAWIQAFRVKGLTRILDLSADETWAEEGLPLLIFGLLHTGPLREYADRSQGWKPEYLIPRYIADCAKEKGFEGIRFKSVRHTGVNYVLFDSAAKAAAPEGEPAIHKAADWKAEWKYLPPEKWPKFVREPIEVVIPEGFEDLISI